MAPARRSSLRAGALLGAGALSLHELRYFGAWGSGAQRALDVQGHAYLVYLMPVVVGLVAACLGQVVHRIGHARVAGAAPEGRTRWLSASGVLLAIYAAQETVEGLLAAGHPSGLAGVFGHGGLIAIPLALAIGGVIALAERRVRAALRAPSKLGLAVARSPWPTPCRSAHPTPLRKINDVGELALHLCGRAPPRGAR